MECDWLELVAILLIVDSACAFVMAWFGRQWWMQVLGGLARHFPPVRGWTALYLTLAVFIGYLAGLFG